MMTWLCGDLKDTAVFCVIDREEAEAFTILIHFGRDEARFFSISFQTFRGKMMICQGFMPFP